MGKRGSVKNNYYLIYVLLTKTIFFLYTYYTSIRLMTIIIFKFFILYN